MLCVAMCLPNDLNITVTRNYGETAKDKSNELLKHLLIATLSVTLLIALALGWRESGVVLLAVPVTLALTLAIFYLYGYTLNRVTLFALIFSIGILVDDAIVVVENIVRHFRLPESRGRPLAEVAVEAVDEVGNPDDPCDVRRHRRHPAHGLRARPDGSLHATDSGGSVGGHAVFPDGGLRSFALGSSATAAETMRARAAMPNMRAKAGRPVCIAA